MHSKDVLLFCSSLLLLTLSEAWIVAPVFGPQIRYVPTQYPTIQAAINAANPGDTVFVYNGTYHEHIIVDKRLTVAGQDRDITIIDGSTTGTVVDISADTVDIHGFTIQNGGDRYNAIVIGSTFNNVIISGNIIKNSVTGISIAESNGNTITGNTILSNSINGISITYSLSNNIRNNVIADSAYAMKLDSTNRTFISGNTVSNTSYGIYVVASTNNTVDDNIATGNSFGVLAYLSSDIIVKNNTVSGSTYGIEVHTSTAISVLNNTLTNNPSYSIYLAYSDGNTVKGNSVSQSDWGIDLYDSSGNTIAQNTVSDNTYGFYISNNAGGNNLYHNNIISNVKQAFQDLTSSNTWNTPTTPYQGNYWSDYKGADDGSGGRQAGDGIGDTYIPWAAVDWYPLMAPWGVHDVAITSVTIPVTEVYKGTSVNITVIAKNEGGMTETFTVKTYANSTLIGQQTVSSLASGASETLFFMWDTSTFPRGLYIIKAEAVPVPSETDTADNTYVDGSVRVKLQGDVNDDGRVDITDLAIVAQAYNTKVGDPNYNPDADLNNDGRVDVWDLHIVAKNYGTSG